MDHVAIDLGGRESQICIRREDGEIIEETRRATATLGRYLARRARSRVVLETCAEAFSVAEAARDAGHDVKVVPASLVRALGVGARGVKTDVRDARNLSEASCRMSALPSVHVRRAVSRERKSMTGMRESLVETRTKLVSCVRGWLRGRGLGVLRTGAMSSFTRRVRERVRDVATSLPSYVDRHLRTIDGLNRDIDEADAELKQLAEADQICGRLMTVPGVGPVTALRFAAALDEVGRFSNAHAVEAYLGLTPGEQSSSERRRITSITKAGSAKVRWALVQAACSARRWRRADPMVLWSLRIEERRGKQIATVALARKMAGVLFAIWRDGTVYRADHERDR